MQNVDRQFGKETFIWVTAFFLSNFRGTIVWDFLKQGFQLTALPWIEIMGWTVLLVMSVWSLRRDHLVGDYLGLWKRNWLLVLFIAVAFLSLSWSDSFSASLYRALALLSVSLIGAYLGIRYSLERLLCLLFRFGSILLMVCLALVIFYPMVSTMVWEPYDGAWRGIFWHKNQLGSLIAMFSLVFLIRILKEPGNEKSKPTLDVVFYIFSLVVIFFSKSVAGYFLGFFVGFCTAVAFFWLKIRHRLSPIHYFGILGIGIVAGIVVLFNLDWIFGIFNRDTSLTGRVPLWSYLIREIFLRSPWLGHGFGAIWSTAAFRIETQQILGWGYPVAIADNGFLDILLHVGLLGFIPFLGILVTTIGRSARLVMENPSIVNFFPLLLMIYAVLANISFSLFLETEMFLWLVIVAVLFYLTKQ